MVLNESKANGDTILNTEYNTIAATVNDITDNGLPQKIFFSGTDHEGIVLISLTTTQRDALSPSTGAVIWNTTNTRLEYYNGSSWNPVDTTQDLFDESSPQLSANLDVNNNDLQNIGVAEFNAEYDNGDVSTSATIDFTNGNYQTVNLTGNTTLSVTPPSGPTSCQLRVTGGDSNSITWWSITWLTSGGAAPTLDGSDIVGLFYDGTNWYGVNSNQS